MISVFTCEAKVKHKSAMRAGCLIVLPPYLIMNTNRRKGALIVINLELDVVHCDL